MGSAAYREIPAKSALTRVQGMPFEWSLNPYRGCEHACVYCYARDYFARMGRDPLRGFDREIEVKINVASLLRDELRRGRASGTVAIGTGTDPYQQCEGRYRLTRACLEAFAERPLPLVLITKGTLIVRDVDVLASISERVEVRVFFSIGSVDPAISRSLEPSAPPPAKRLVALQRLRAAGIRASVICAPIVPGLSDSEASIAAVAEAAHAHGSWTFASRILKLDPGVRPGYLDYIAETFPALYPRYLARYAGVKLDPAYAEAIEARVERASARFRFPAEDEPEAVEDAEDEQLRLAI